MLARLVITYLSFYIASQSIDAIKLSETKPTQPSEIYTHSSTADDDDSFYTIFWKRFGDEEIQFEVHCRTLGWVGFGLSPTGGMTGADIAIGWVKDGVGYLKDTHATGFKTPVEDAIQDLVLLDAAELDGYTMLKFKRKLNTCDKDHDNEIKHETHYLLFAWNDADPVTGLGDWRYHGSNRRTRADLLLVFKDENLVEEAEDAQDAIAIDFKLNNLPVKTKDTYYHCQFFEVPQFEEPMHMIRYQMLVEKNNRDIFHHLVIHECPESTVNTISSIGLVGHECGMVNPPSYVRRCLESAIIVAWNFSFPKNTGFPINKTPTKRYYLFEFHFDNPRLDSGRFDSSGIRMFYTPKLREFDLGVLQLTSGYNKLDLAIPPKSQDLTISSICYPDCINKFVSVNGINVFSGFLHTHLAGRSVRTKLVRGNRVIKYLFDNPKYDFNYQFNIEIEPEIIRRGDELILECTFETLDRNGTIYFGHSSLDEMCMNFVYYYPKISNFELCRSTTTPKSLYDFIRQLSKEGLVPPVILSDTNISQSNNIIINFMNDPNVWTDELRQRYKEFYSNPGPQYATCGSQSNLADSLLNLEKPFSLPFDEVAQSVLDKCKVN